LAQLVIAAPIVTGLTLAAIQQVPERFRLQLLALGASRAQLVWTLIKEARLPMLAAVMAGFGAVISEVGASLMVGGNIKGSTRVPLVMGSTGNLAKQIEHGAPADVFFAANASFVDDLQTAGAVIPQTRALYAQGRIVLATPTKPTVVVRELADLLKPEVRRVA